MVAIVTTVASTKFDNDSMMSRFKIMGTKIFETALAYRL